MMLETGMIDVVMSGMVITVVTVLVTYVVVPPDFFGHVSSMVAVTGGMSIVVSVESVHGGRTNVHGG